MGRPIKQPPIRFLPIRAKHAASGVSTGQKLFAEGGDGRSAWGRRWRDLILAHVADLGGSEDLSEAQVSIIRRASAVQCELEGMEARRSEGQEIDLELYGRVASRLCRLLELVDFAACRNRSIRSPTSLGPWRAMRASLSTTTTSRMKGND